MNFAFVSEGKTFLNAGELAGCLIVVFLKTIVLAVQFCDGDIAIIETPLKKEYLFLQISNHQGHTLLFFRQLIILYFQVQAQILILGQAGERKISQYFPLLHHQQIQLLFRFCQLLLQTFNFLCVLLSCFLTLFEEGCQLIIFSLQFFYDLHHFVPIFQLLELILHLFDLVYQSLLGFWVQFQNVGHELFLVGRIYAGVKNESNYHFLFAAFEDQQGFDIEPKLSLKIFHEDSLHLGD